MMGDRALALKARAGIEDDRQGVEGDQRDDDDHDGPHQRAHGPLDQRRQPHDPPSIERGGAMKKKISTPMNTTRARATAKAPHREIWNMSLLGTS